MHSTIKLAAIFGALAVAIGAFGAHGLKGILEATDRVDTFETAVKYHFYHTLALFLIGVLQRSSQSIWLKRGAWLMVVGILIFSGTLYTLSLTGLTWLGAITPIGGVAFILGWGCIFLGIKKA